MGLLTALDGLGFALREMSHKSPGMEFHESKYPTPHTRISPLSQIMVVQAARRPQA